jgi:HTH-type transcriptional regulator/antitoxin HigA
MDALIKESVLAEVTTHFQALKSVIPLHPIRSEADFDFAVLKLNQLLDAGAADESHALADLANTLGALVAAYDDAHHPAADVSATDMLRFLMDQHGLSQSELPELGTQGVVSEILGGKRELNLRQVKALAQRFHIPAGAFI